MLIQTKRKLRTQIVDGWAGYLTSWLASQILFLLLLYHTIIYIREETDTVDKIIKMRFMNFWVIILIYGIIYSVISVLLYL